MKIVVAMSGGVDSSVAAALLAEQGHDVIGLSMQLYDQSEGQTTFGSCCSLDDLYDARRVAHAIGIPHYILNFEKEFNEQVVSNFVREYTSGRTPIPCARCNSDLKFATLAERASAFGADAVATGHYARTSVDPTSGKVLLKRGVDHAKDQAYFLFSLTQAQLARAIFPVGDVSKDVVREYARRYQLAVADKPDSQEICFVPDDDYAAFVAMHAEGAPAGGTIVDEAGHAVGTHDGIHRFTVGQRKGLGLRTSPDGQPRYVLALRPVENQVVVGPRSALERTTLTASCVNWILGRPDGPLRVSAQIRHRHTPASAVVRAIGAADEQRAEVVFDAPQVAITPGQAVVFYDDDVVVGGGWID
ncbi:MAG: tRNA 2-thiouridine(34) synthase MnmA [Vicinamibacterales bacterium]